MAYNPVAALQNWARSYVGNATSVRDYRSQLRGNRSVWLWASYLLVLIAVTAAVYAANVSGRNRSIVEMQSELRTFYQMLMAILGGIVCLVSPAMAATSVVAERQRKSLDLVFSAPVETSYYLMGKMLSCFRYTWILLILSLPVVSVAIVMGGASWGDVIVSFVMLSMIGLVFSALGLLISTLSQNLVSSIIYAYVAVIGYNIATGVMFSSSLASTMMTRSQEAAFTGGLNPFTVGWIAPTYTTLMGKEIPNWILVAVFCLLATKTLVMAASSILSPYRSRDTVVFRAWALGFAFVAFGIIAGSMVPPAVGSSVYTAHIPGLVLGYAAVMQSFFVMPHLTAYGNDDLRRYWFDGDFNLRAAFVGTPAGALPFVLMQWLAMVAGSALGMYLLQSVWPNGLFWLAAFWCLGYSVLWWCVGRWTSELSRSLRAARTGVFMAILTLVVMPLPLLSIVQTASYGSRSEVWVMYLLYPLSTSENMELAWVYALIMIAIGTVLYSFAVSRRKLRREKETPIPPPAPPPAAFEV